jgi:LysR family glycine cleavage system transcriptional activator
MRNDAMSRGPFELPPLELLVAFESAARHLSFTRAAEEVALTQSAVSRQVLALESRLGVALFRRMHRALALTEDGSRLYAATLEALGRIDRATREIRRSERVRTVVVTTTPGFAGLWLIPRLAGFVSTHPGVDVRISASNTLVNLDRDGVDLAIRYRSVETGTSGAGTRLFGEIVFPVCSPRLRRPPFPPLKVPGDLVAHTLLRMEPDGHNQLQDWGLWLHAMGLDDLRPAGVLHFSSYDQLISAALAGQGVALGRMPLISSSMKGRKLVAPFSDRVASPRSYFMLASTAAAAKPEVQDFMAWLEAEARDLDSARPRGRARA